MARPMIFIGIGTSGLRVLEHTQRFYFEATKTTKPSYVQYIYLETNKDNYPEAVPNDIIREYISLNQMARMVTDLKRDTNAQWLPETNYVVEAGLGAGGIRNFGRLALWGANDEGSNFGKVFRTIKNAYDDVASHTQQGTKDSRPVIYIVGSLTGGTGSGIFIDMAYIVREIISDSKDVYGLFLLPNKPIMMSGEEVKYANTYGALKDLEAFNNVESIYKEKWPSGKDISSEKPPYELVQFISQDYQDGSPAIRNLSGLYKMAGLYLYLNMVGMHEKRHERLVDSAGNDIIGKYGTFALSGIQFPKDQIEEFVASQLSIELLERWTDANQYVVNNEKKQINPALINQAAQKKWDEILKEAFKSLNIIGNRDLVSEIHSQAIKINRKEIGDEKEYINKLFGSMATDGYYAIVRGNIQTAIDLIIERIHDMNVDGMNRYENLYFSKLTIEAIDKAIERCVHYWQSLGLSEKTENWDNYLRKQITWILENRYKSIFEQDQVVKDRMVTTFELMKMHLTFSKLNEIRTYLTKKEIDYKASVSRKELPQVRYFDTMIKSIRQVIGTVEMDANTKPINTFISRNSEIKQDIEDETIPILRIFQNGTFEREVHLAKQNYVQKTQSVLSRKDVTTQDLWEFLKSSINDIHAVLYRTCATTYKASVNEKKCVSEDFDVTEYVEKNADRAKKIAEKGTTSFISVNKTLGTSYTLPRFVGGSEQTKVVKVINTLEKVNFNEFRNSADGIFVIPELKNMVIFFDEKGNFVPTKDLTYIEQMRNVYERRPSGLIEDSNVDDTIWQKRRNAYIVEKRNNN